MGAFLGILLLNYVLGLNYSWLLFLPIGIGAAVGDMVNSIAKRINGIKNWSNLIPGHGGFLDRFCSLAGSVTLVYYYIKLF